VAEHSGTDRANAQFKKLQKSVDGKKAMSEYETEQAAVRAKTERLKALRLARDAAQEAAPAKAPVAAKKKAKAVKKEKTSASLARWLADQKASGRQS
jgi:hypothetical protein